MANWSITTENADGVVAPDTQAEVQMLADRVRQQKETLGIPQMAGTFELSNGGQVFVQDLDYVQRAHIVEPVTTELPDYIATDDEWGSGAELPIISFVSGVANPLSYPRHNNVRWQASDDTARFFTADEVELKLGGKTTTDLNEITLRQPGRYTGVMAPVVQLLLGVGNLLENDYERRWCAANSVPLLATPELHIFKEDDESIDAEDDVETEVLLTTPLDSVQTVARIEREPDDDGVYATLAVQYRFDSARTHGICFAQRTPLDDAPDVSMVADHDRLEEPMLVEVGDRGLYVMALPRDPASFYKEVRDQYRRVYPGLRDHKVFGGKSFFKKLGGFPTGLGFPSSKDDLDKWVRSGVVTYVELPDFYEHPPGIDAYVVRTLGKYNGWAFSDSGHMATQVFTYEDKEHFRHTFCVVLELDISQREGIVFNENADILVEMLGLSDAVDIAKAYRLSDEQMMGLAESLSKDAFDALTVPSDWDVDVRWRIEKRGYVGGVNQRTKSTYFSRHTPEEIEKDLAEFGEMRLNADNSLTRTYRNVFLPCMFETYNASSAKVAELKETHPAQLSWSSDGKSVDYFLPVVWRQYVKYFSPRWYDGAVLTYELIGSQPMDTSYTEFFITEILAKKDLDMTNNGPVFAGFVGDQLNLVSYDTRMIGDAATGALMSSVFGPHMEAKPYPPPPATFAALIMASNNRNVYFWNNARRIIRDDEAVIISSVVCAGATGHTIVPMLQTDDSRNEWFICEGVAGYGEMGGSTYWPVFVNYVGPRFVCTFEDVQSISYKSTPIVEFGVPLSQIEVTPSSIPFGILG